GRVGLHHPHVHAHGARVPVRRIQVPARAELDHRRAAARDGPRRGLHRLPAAVGSDVVLGDGGRHQHQRHRAVPRTIPRAVPAGRHVHQHGHAVALLRDPHAHDSRRDRGADRPAPLSRDQARRHLAAVVEGGRRHGAAERQADAARRAQGAHPLRAAQERERLVAMASDRIVERRKVFQQYKEDVKERGKPFYPYAMFHDTVMSLVVVAVIAGLAIVWKYTTPGDHHTTAAGWLGKLYDAPADPGTINFVPRPDWYFYFLFYLLRIFKWPNSVLLGTIGIP